MIHITSNNVWILFCTNIYKHSIILYNCNHERYCSGDFIEKNITPLIVDLLKCQRKDNYTLIVLEMQSFINKTTHIHEVGSQINIIKTTKGHNFSCCISDFLISIDLGSTSTTITNIEKRLHFQNYQCVVVFSLTFQQINNQRSNIFFYKIPTTITFVVTRHLYLV
jgi:hypothetical protein